MRPFFALACLAPLYLGNPVHAQGSQSPLLNIAAQLNGLAPQAVPAQTVQLGSWSGATHQMSWSIPLVYPPNLPESKKAENGGYVQPHPEASINSYAVTYEITLVDAPSDLALSLVGPDEHGEPSETPGTVDPAGHRARIAFHPHSNGQQTLRFRGGGQDSQETLVPHLAEQLGAFVVPYLLISIVYEPPGAESTAVYSASSTAGTTVSWGFARSSGLIDTENPNALGDLFMQGAAAGVGAFNGVMGAAVSILGQLNGSTTIQTTDQETQAQTQSQGTSFTVTASFDTSEHQYPGHGDRFVILRNVLFVYLVQAGRVHLAPMAYAAPPRAMTLADMQQAGVPAELVQQFSALDPLLSGKLPGQSLGGKPVAASLALGKAAGARFRHFAIWGSETSGGDGLTVTQSEIASSGLSETVSHIELTQSTGIIASIEGNGDPLWGVTYSSAREQYQQDEIAATIRLQCGPGEEPFSADVWIDTLFHTLLCVKGPPLDTQSYVSGTLSDEGGAPHIGQRVSLRLGERTFMVATNSRGEFRFPFRGLAAGPGALVAGKQAWPLTYDGSAISGLRLGLSRTGQKLQPGTTGSKASNPTFPLGKKKNG